MRRIKLRFSGQEIEFTDREVAIRQIEKLAEKGTWNPVVIYGPEGCGKSAFLKQAVEVLGEYDYSVVKVSPLEDESNEKLRYSEELRGLFRDIMTRIPTPFNDASALIDIAISLLYDVVRRRIRRKIALLADDVFQAIGLDKAELLVKRLLNMIEYSSVDYERIVVIVATSEGVTWGRIGRHRWAEIMAMWNMPREGFGKLYNALPGPKPPFEEVWRWTGGNPKALEMLYKKGWDINNVVNEVIFQRKVTELVSQLNETEKEILEQALEDPDVLLRRIRDGEKLLNTLIDMNLVLRVPEFRTEYLWVDQPPPERDLGLGIGRYYTWQTPLHREAVRRALEN
ncbi:ATP-binding protein [Caldivirga maquilingensis]|uniref:ATPase domain-containing protein n=1 Tax=Caldivirga maquilingensis (strain ATCC 700844 / DSM 13496 / JCM 10307 / IC-167) TaxID=397948 RepID=A8M939_CALMQ|nr:ATP-binding protein [Caldivirga maquilingensis]ABW02258.1 conserved hypothetical protein [Caldivirga maquilingensis IC-167]